MDLIKLHEVGQNSGETVHAFAERIRQMCARVDAAMGERAKVGHFVAGLLPEYKEAVLNFPGNLATFEMAVAAAAAREVASQTRMGASAQLNHINSEYKKLQDEVATLKLAMAAMRANNNNYGGGGGAYGGGRGQGQWGRCYVCSGYGHQARDCPSGANARNEVPGGEAPRGEAPRGAGNGMRGRGRGAFSRGQGGGTYSAGGIQEEEYEGGGFTLADEDGGEGEEMGGAGMVEGET